MSLTASVKQSVPEKKRLRRLELQFLRAEKKALIALTTLACGIGSASALDELNNSHASMQALLPEFEAQTGKMLDRVAMNRLEQAVAAVTKAGNEPKAIEKAIPRATKTLNLAHRGLTRMLPDWFKPIVSGVDKPDTQPPAPTPEPTPETNL